MSLSNNRIGRRVGGPLGRRSFGGLQPNRVRLLSAVVAAADSFCQRRSSIATALFTGPGWTNLLVLSGLLWTIFGGCRLLWWSRPTRRTFRGAYFGPQLCIAAGCWLSFSVNTVWFVAVVAVLLALTALALNLLDGAGPEHSGPTGAAAAAVLTAAVLLQLGALLAIRLVIVPEPDAALLAAFDRTAIEEGFSALGQPLLALAAALLVLWALRARSATRMALLRSVRAGLVRLAALLTSSDPPWAGGHRVAVAGTLSTGAMVAFFLLPLAGDRVGDAALTVGGVATPEYGKLGFLLLLAVVVARHSHRFDASSRIRRRDLLRLQVIDAGWATRMRLYFHEFRYALYPIALFGLVALASGVRQDLGTLVAALAATIGVTWAATRHTVLRFPDAGSGGLFRRTVRRLFRMVAAYRHFLNVGLVLFVFAVVSMLSMASYVGERAQIWADPWAFRWAAGCAPPAPGDEVPRVPAGMMPCQRSLAADVESERSQLGQVLSAVADGGLWGRGLRDTGSGRVAAGSTDFILAVMWNKLGGLVVLCCAVVMVLLGVALARATRPSSPEQTGTAPTVAALLGSGLAAMIVGQALFVYAATLNVVPHSGVPAPLLSRGGQSNVAILLGVLGVLALARAGRGEPGRATAGRAGGRPAIGWGTAGESGPVGGRAVAGPRGRLGALVPVGLFAVMTAAITVWPYPAPRPGHQLLPTAYAENRPPCPARGDNIDGLVSPPPDPRTCSTNQFAVNRTRIDLRFTGGAGGGMVRSRPAGEWTTESNTVAGLVVEDLAGLLRVGAGHSGVLENTYGAVLAGSVSTGLASRLRPWPRSETAHGGLDLTLDPRLQHVAADALRTGGPDGVGPLAGGVVAIDARTGQILIAASAPGQSRPKDSTPATVDPADAARFAADNGFRPTTGSPGASADPAIDCDPVKAGRPGRPDCRRWSYQPASPDVAETAERELRRYVDGDRTVALPQPDVNRAMGKRYGLGSTFKVVIAAAYLDQPGTTAADLLPAPVTVALSDTTAIRNAGGGACPGTTEDGKITLTRALAVSCNTAFVTLAQRLGWDRIAGMARRFGLTVSGAGADDCADAGPGLANRLVGAVASCVPAVADPVAIGNNALGGQDVHGTPMGMAAVLAAVANGGRATRPVLVAAVRVPESGEVRRTETGPARTVLSPEAAAELKSALSETAVDGTAKGMGRAVGAPLWVKTGTHEVVPEGTQLESGRFVRQIAWLAGFIDTDTGPVAFAVAVETRNERAGARHARWLAETVCVELGRRQ